MRKAALFFCLGALLYSQKVIYINLSTQKLVAKEDGKVVLDGAVSSGRIGRETPTGTYRISLKKVKHKSNLWPKPNGGAEMPYMMKLGSTPMALHLGNLPGYPASHGCVRMEKAIAKKVFEWAEIGTPVKIFGKTPRHKKFKRSFVSGYRDISDAGATKTRNTSPEDITYYLGDIVTRKKEGNSYEYIDKMAHY